MSKAHIRRACDLAGSEMQCERDRWNTKIGVIAFADTNGWKKEDDVFVGQAIEQGGCVPKLCGAELRMTARSVRSSRRFGYERLQRAAAVGTRVGRRECSRRRTLRLRSQRGGGQPL